MDLPEVNSKSFVPEGGLDLVSPLLLLKDGVAFEARNYECDEISGVSRIGGYDRYVNGPTASEMDFRLATLNISTSVSSSEILRGGTSNATLKFGARTSGTNPQRIQTQSQSWVYEVLGQFVAGEALFRGVVQVGTLTAIPSDLSGTTDRAYEISRAAAQAAVRAYMDKPGSGVFQGVIGVDGAQVVGPVLGVFVLEDLSYVVRAKNPQLSATDAVPQSPATFLRPATIDAGFSNRYWEVAFDGVYAGQTIDSVGAEFEFEISNFNDPSGPLTAWGVSKTSKAFNYSAETGVMQFITTGMAVDKPTHLAIHANRLFLSFGGSIQFSPINTPFAAWSVVVGASEISMGSPVTGLLSLKGESGKTALLISTKERMSILYGDSTETFQLVPFSNNTGALPRTMTNVGQAIFQNIFGITSLATSQRFGGFQESTLSEKIKPFIEAHRGKATSCMSCRDKNQYRLFFSDGTATYMTFNTGRGGTFTSIGVFVEKYKHQVTCSWSCVLSDSTELMLIGTEDGGLYKLDVGSSFAGETIEHYIRFAFNHLGSPRVNKHFMRAIIELQAQGFVGVEVGYDLDYGSLRRDVTDNQFLESGPEGGIWDDGNWDEGGYWDAATATPMTVDTPGTGVNISLRFRGNDNITNPFTIPAILLDFTTRKKRRS